MLLFGVPTLQADQWMETLLTEVDGEVEGGELGTHDGGDKREAQGGANTAGRDSRSSSQGDGKEKDQRMVSASAGSPPPIPGVFAV